MTAIDLDGGTFVPAGSRSALMFRLKRLLVLWRRRRRSARRYAALARLDARLLADMGLEPLDLQEALKARLPPSMLLDAMRRQLDQGRPPRGP